MKSKTIHGSENGRSKGKKMRIGPVLKKGKNLPSSKNIASYIDKLGRMDAVSYASDHKAEFDIIWIVVQCEASRRVVEVGCERFFNLSGYVSSPKRTQLGVRNYERLAMLASIVQSVYVDVEWVAKEYLARSKRSAWTEENTVESLKCWNLEHVIEAENFGKNVPKDITMTEFVRTSVNN